MQTEKIIFVDDEDAILELYQDIFETTPYKVFTEKNPLKALKTINKQRIQVMFFDLKMPEMDGTQLCRKIRETNSVAVIHAVTGHSSLFELSEVREAGFDDYFKKPIDPELILEAADRAFNKLERWAHK
ncbi:MAG: response regulator [Candidatus Marinimicrobia bacterium]|nr:response regulator [Candidatus Neomarinimicrobiota bacterium]